MNIIKLFAISLFLLSALDTNAQSRFVAFTFDDLPCSNCKNLTITLDVNNKLLNMLKANNITAMGFVNESKLYSNDTLIYQKVEILKNWIENGQELGNHTYSHLDINITSLQQYESDILKGEVITNQILQKYNKNIKYFRHPFLRQGQTQSIKGGVDSILHYHNYISVPVTMDNDEYIFAFCYKKALENKDTAKARLIVDEYLEYLSLIIHHYETLSIKILNYNVKHILLLHANELNSDYLQNIIQVFRNEGYSFIPPEEALSDKVYSMKGKPSKRGLSILNGLELERDLPPSMHPEPSNLIIDMFKQLQK